MLFVSDVHGAFDALRRVVGRGQPVVVLGDLANLNDYRNGEGAIADVMGVEFARAAARSRATGDYGSMRELWMDQVGDRADEVRAAIGEAIAAQYRTVSDVLEGGRGWVIHGNVDRPGRLAECLPDGFEYVHGQVVEIDGMRVGFAGGGVRTALRTEGEVADDEMVEILGRLGHVDVLCTHVPPATRSLRADVITGREERGSEPIRSYLLEHQPRFHFFGDVHQPQATRWRLGNTECHNAGYFRATGRFLSLRGAMVDIGRLG